MAWNWADITNPAGAPTRQPWNWAAVSAPQTGGGEARRQALLGTMSGGRMGSRTGTAGAGSDVFDRAYNQQMQDVAALGGADNLRNLIGNELASQMPAPQAPSYMGMSPEELLAYLLESGGGGGGGVDLSGYNTMLSDIAGRESALGGRKAEQEAFLTSLFDAAEARATADREALAAAIESQLANDAARRATEIGLIREGDVNRAATANAAREALGVAPGVDLTSNVVENVASGVGASGSVADRDARIRESIANQQLNREIAGLTPMEQMAVMGLNREYENRLAALASERAAIQSQMAQARASYRGPSGPSISDRINALSFVQGAFAPGEAPTFEGPLGAAQQIQSYFGPAAADVLGIANRILTSAQVSRIDPTSAAGANELLTQFATSDPEVRNFLNQYPEAAGIIVNYVVQASK